MLDIKRISENPFEIAKNSSNRNKKYYDYVLMLAKKYQEYKVLLQKIESKSFDRKKLTREMILNTEKSHSKRLWIAEQSEKIKSSKNKNVEFDKLKEIAINNSDSYDKQLHIIREKQTDLKLEIQNLTTEKDKLFDQIQTNLLELPNTLESAVPIGENESENVEVDRWSEPKKFDFTPKPHWDIIKSLDIVDFERSVKLSGSRFVSYKKSGAKLMRALQNYMIDYHINKFGYEELMPPVIVNSTSLMGTGQLPKFESDLFKIQHDKEYYLSPTAEVQITNFHQDEIINASDLPLKYCASTLCFRSEAGSAGRDTRGLIRMHQFNKIEIVKIVKPENSQEEHESLTEQAAGILKELKLPYRKMLLCAGDTGFSAQKTYDLEVWLPSYNNYKEISSCSNFGDFQARRAKIRFKRELNSKAELVHTLNGSGLALDRTFAAIVENYQNKDGTITIPEVLVPYMNGQTKII